MVHLQVNTKREKLLIVAVLRGIFCWTHNCLSSLKQCKVLSPKESLAICFAMPGVSKKCKIQTLFLSDLMLQYFSPGMLRMFSDVAGRLVDTLKQWFPLKTKTCRPWFMGGCLILLLFFAIEAMVWTSVLLSYGTHIELGGWTNPFGTYTLPETNIATENHWWEWEHEVSFYDGRYSGTNDFREGGGIGFWRVLYLVLPCSNIYFCLILIPDTACMAHLPTFV